MLLTPTHTNLYLRKTTAMGKLMAVPSILMVAPRDSTKLATAIEIQETSG